MICPTCETLFCRCFTEAHKRQPEGVVYTLMIDDNAPHSDYAEERKKANRLYFQRIRDKKRVRTNG
jgi:hypothetical protein